ncbi:protein kinase [Streptomyces sp. NPDC047000]|uniref:protein kinase n=1 Tax=Streptomyces sp. NPDC047000 TaxID=3155474 RepID=UPI0033C90FB1
MDDYAGRVLADRYRLPLPPSDEYELTETRAFDTYSGQEVLVRQVPLPEVVEAEVLDADGLPDGFTARDRGTRRPPARTATRRPADPAVRRAVEAAQAAARIPDHPRLDQVFDVFAEGGSLWIVSEVVAARPLAALLAETPLTPYRAAEVASDVLMALRVLHAHGWVHRNITARTVLVCDDGRVMLTGLAVGAAEEALCGYDPVPAPEGDEAPDDGGTGPITTGPATTAHAAAAGHAPTTALGPGGPGASAAPGAPGPSGDGGDPEAARRAAIQARESRGLPSAGADTPGAVPGPAAIERRAVEPGGDVRAARAGAIAAYRAGARAAARIQEAQQNGRAALPGGPAAAAGGAGADRPGAEPSYRTGNGTHHQPAPPPAPPGQIADPYGVRGTPRPGAVPPPAGPAQGRTALPPAGNGAADGNQAPLPSTPPGTRPHPHPFPSAGAPPLQPHTGGPTGLTPADPHGTPRARGQAPAIGASGTVEQAALGPGRWDDPAAGTPARRGPATALAAERARQARMTVVGPVTERWAPEQAGPVHENWQLAAPIGPATDLWALGALLFRAVQGHAPYPEESTAELVQLVCAEPPAYAEECGPLRPVVESLLRQDPTDRLDFEELRGWLRSLVRSAPEPEAGAHVVATPPTDPSRLPIVRRRGELVRRRRAGLPATSVHGRHKRAREEDDSPRRLGRTLLLLILLLLAGAVAYAMLFMPKAGEQATGHGDRTGAAGEASPVPQKSAGAGGQAPGSSGSSAGTSQGDGDSSSQPSDSASAQTTDPDVADGFTLRKDPEGFQVAVAKGWSRTPKNSRAQVVYTHGDFELIVVPGRDSASSYGSDPMTYQRDKERELAPYRDSSWATATGLRTIQVGGRTMAEGQFTWTDDQGHDLFVRNIAILIDGRYHVLQVRGPDAQRDEVTTLYEQASATYRYTG